MIRVNTNSFIFGKDKFPDWFVNYPNVNYEYNEEYEIIGATVNNLKITNGDTVMLLGKQIQVIKKKDAKKFGLE